MKKIILIIALLISGLFVGAQTYTSDVALYKENDEEFKGIYTKTEIKINEDKKKVDIFLLESEVMWGIDVLYEKENEGVISYIGVCGKDSSAWINFNKSKNLFMFKVNEEVYIFKNAKWKDNLIAETYTSDRTELINEKQESEGSAFRNVEIDIDERKELIYISFFDQNIQWKLDVLYLNKLDNGNITKYICKRFDGKKVVVGYSEKENFMFLKIKKGEGSSLRIFEHIKIKKS